MQRAGTFGPVGGAASSDPESSEYRLFGSGFSGGEGRVGSFHSHSNDSMVIVDPPSGTAGRDA